MPVVQNGCVGQTVYSMQYLGERWDYNNSVPPRLVSLLVVVVVVRIDSQTNQCQTNVKSTRQAGNTPMRIARIHVNNNNGEAVVLLSYSLDGQRESERIKCLLSIQPPNAKTVRNGLAEA